MFNQQKMYPYKTKIVYLIAAICLIVIGFLMIEYIDLKAVKVMACIMVFVVVIFIRQYLKIRF